MNKKISLTVTEDSYKKLSSLSDFYNLDVENAIISILDVVGREEQWIINLSKDYKVPVKLTTVMSHIFFAGFHSMRTIFNEVLENLEVKGLYTLSDFDIDLDENYMWLSYAALRGCNLLIDQIDITLKSGLKGLTTHSYIEVKKVNNKVLGKLKELVESIEIPPREFGDVTDYKIEVEEDDEFWHLRIDFTDESLSYLPSVKGISKFVERIFKKAGIKNKKAKN